MCVILDLAPPPSPSKHVVLLQTDLDVHTVDRPLPSPEQAPEPLHAEASPLGPLRAQLVSGDTSEGLDGGVEHLDDHEGPIVWCGLGARAEPVATEVEEAPIGPVARREEEDEEEYRAVDARLVEEVGAHEEEEYEGGRGVGGDEEEREPTIDCQSVWVGN